MSERVILAGGGGFCRELYFWALDCHAAGRLPAIGGYLDDSGPSLAHLDYPDLPWLGSVEDYVPLAGDRFFLAVGSPTGKRVIHGKLATRGGVFAQLVHPDTRLLRTATIGEGVILCPQTALGPDAVLERFVTFNASSGAGHDARVGEFSTISSLVDITGYVQIGRDVMIGDSAVLLPKIKIGDGAIIGAGAVVYRSVPAGATAYAAPAKLLKRAPAAVSERNPT